MAESSAEGESMKTNQDTLDTRWIEIAELIHTRWSKFSKREIDSLHGNLDDLAGKIQKVYGYARDHAERECHQFQISIRPLFVEARHVGKR